MESKLFEIRDRATFLPVIATKMQTKDFKEFFLLRRSGFSCSDKLIELAILGNNHSKFTYDSSDWEDGTRTMSLAHKHIEDNWAELKTGDVIDIEYVLGEVSEPKISERLEIRRF